MGVGWRCVADLRQRFCWAVETGLLNTQLERKVPEEGVTEPDEEIKVDGKVIESREQLLTEIKPHGADPDCARCVIKCQSGYKTLVKRRR